MLDFEQHECGPLLVGQLVQNGEQPLAQPSSLEGAVLLRGRGDFGGMRGRILRVPMETTTVVVRHMDADLADPRSE